MQTASEKRIRFYDVCRANGLTISEFQLDQIETYINLLLDWNTKINLVSRKDQENIWSYHILHSVSLLFLIDIPQESRIVDIGTGGGLPGVPIKILRPDLQVLCLDSTGKKIKAVSEIISELKLKEINAIWGRAEEIGSQKEYAEKFDFALARAVASLSDLVAWAKPFLKKSLSRGVSSDNEASKVCLIEPTLLVYKGGNLEKEVELAHRRFPHINIDALSLVFEKSLDLIEPDKKILMVKF